MNFILYIYIYMYILHGNLGCRRCPYISIYIYISEGTDAGGGAQQRGLIEPCYRLNSALIEH